MGISQPGHVGVCGGADHTEGEREWVEKGDIQSKKVCFGW